MRWIAEKFVPCLISTTNFFPRYSSSQSWKSGWRTKIWGYCRD